MKSTIPSSAVRQVPAFTVPSTQNTAPVLEYRCLYTHDLRRKQKRWQDGLLRFHTFNKRIMVYDVSRNYIGDMHWREDEILQDGDEFELDRGVLIQVGEATGSREQDLTGLFEKRKKAPEVTLNEEVPHQPVAVPMARSTTAQPSQLRPKTLNALLGTPKGRVGRAALPTKSPHELENSSWDPNRPAKRQRIDSPLKRRVEPNKIVLPRVPATIGVSDEVVKRAVAGVDVDKLTEERRVPTTERKSGLSRVGNAVIRPPVPPFSKNRIEKEDEASRRVVEPLPKKRSGGSGSVEMIAQQRKRKPDLDVQESPKAKSTTRGLDHEPKTGYARTSSLIKPIEIASDTDAKSTYQPPQPRLKLQMASRKPRKKLMYRDLLSQEPSAISRSSSDASVQERRSCDRNTSIRLEKRKKDPMADFHKEQRDQLNARLNRHRAKEAWRDNERGKICGDPPEDLFLSQEDKDAMSANVHGTGEKDPKEKAAISSMTESCRRSTESVPPSTRHLFSPDAFPKMIPRPTSTVYSTAMALAKMDEILFSREDHAISPEVLPLELSSPPILKNPLDAISTPPPPEDRPHPSPAIRTQAHVPSSKDMPREAISTRSRPHPDSLSAFTKAVQPKTQAPKRQSPDIPPIDPHVPSTPSTPPNTVPAPSPPTDHPSPSLGSQTQPSVNRSLEPLIADVPPPTPTAKPARPFTSPTISAPNPTPAPESPPTHKPTNHPAFTKVTPITPTPNPPPDTVEVLSSQPPPSPPPKPPIAAPHPQRNPAFTKVVPSKPRPPSTTAASETSARRSRSGLCVSDGEGNAPVGSAGEEDGTAGVWGREAWDLFGCGRDGVECSYEEFTRQEGRR